MSIAARLKFIRDRITAYEEKYHRASGAVQLLAVSKTRSIAEIQSAIDAGQYHFGENHVQEAIAKIGSIQDPAVIWHFIGPIQSNKTQWIVEYFDWVHSVDRLKIATRLNAQRKPDQTPLNVCIEVNISDEASKSGIAPNQLLPLAEAIVAMPHLRLRGLMAIPAITEDFDAQRRAFQKLRLLCEDLNARGYALDTLSMGMSADFEAAIAEGSTCVRIGTAIFGDW